MYTRNTLYTHTEFTNNYFARKMFGHGKTGFVVSLIHIRDNVNGYRRFILYAQRKFKIITKGAFPRRD